MRILIVAGLATGAILGMVGSMLPAGPAQNEAWEISSVGLIVGALLLAITFFRRGNDTVAAGLALLVLAEAVMSGGTAAGVAGGLSAFGAGVALYVPALLLSSIPKTFPIWSRGAGILAAIPFAAEAALVYSGSGEPPTGPLPSAGYTLLTLAIVGWIVSVVRRRPEAIEAAAAV